MLIEGLKHLTLKNFKNTINMRKSLLFIASMVFSVASFAQFTFSGTVLTSTGAPVASQPVYIMTDSSVSGWNPATMGVGFSTWAMTNSAGAYTATLPSTTLSGHPIMAVTGNCTGPNLVNSHTYAGVNITSNFTKCVPPPPAALSGIVTLGTGTTPAVGAKVMLIRKHPDSVMIGTSWFFTWSLSAVDSAITNSTGGYSFTLTSPRYDSLLVKAYLLPSHSSYSSYLPTYHSSSLVWTGATAISPTVTTSVTANIALIGGTNPGGPGFISGSVLLGANKTTAVGDPLPNRLIILTDAANKPVAYTYSDNAGKFNFAGIAYGTYKIFGDVMGKTSNPLGFTISTSTPSVTTIIFEEKALTFNATMPTGVSSVIGQQHGIYPNPAKDAITISGLTSDATVTIYDMTGRTLVQQAVNAANNTVNIAALATGNYVVKLATAQETTTIKLTKE